MGAGGAYEVSPVNKRMAQLTGRKDFRRNNPVTPLHPASLLHPLCAACKRKPLATSELTFKAVCIESRS